mmetsp:Transcript_126431/g.393498  ORF Transcript_126431/g.393498 Transcript_126431/m.393498 type:complete len:208 (-) Transcript_126431:139-762(-)
MSSWRHASSASRTTASCGSWKFARTSSKTSARRPASQEMRKNCTTAKGGTCNFWAFICNNRFNTASTRPFFRKPLMVREKPRAVSLMRAFSTSWKISSTFCWSPTEANPPRRTSYMAQLGWMSRIFLKVFQSSTMTSTRPARATTSSTTVALFALHRAAACCRMCATISETAMAGSVSTKACTTLLRMSWGVGAKAWPLRHALSTAT